MAARHRPRVALVLGGIASHSRLLQNLTHRGYKSILIDYLKSPPAKPFADEHLQESCLDANVLTAAANTFDASAILTTHLDRTLPVAANACETLGIPYYISSDTALGVTNKVRMKRTFDRIGVPTAKWLVASNDAADFRETLRFPVICKQVDGTGSLGLFIIKDKPTYRALLPAALALSTTNCVLIEEFHEGVELSVDAAITNGISDVLAVRERKKYYSLSGDNVLCYGAIQRRTLGSAIATEIKAIAQEVASGFALTNSPLFLQIIIDKSGRYHVLEIAARLSGGITSRFLRQSSGLDLLDFSVACQLQEQLPVRSRADNATYGVQILYAKPARIHEFRGFEDLLNMRLIESYQLLRVPGDIVPGELTTKSRVAEMVVRGQNPEDVAKKTAMALAAIDVLDDRGRSILIRDKEMCL